MSGGLYSTDNRDFDKSLNLKKVKPYGDTMNDGKVQISLTLPIKSDEVAAQAAKVLAGKMGFLNPQVAYQNALDENFTFFILYGSLNHTVDVTKIKVVEVNERVMSMQEVDSFIEENIGRKVVVIGASTGTDAHTVGIDAIMNMKGFAGHYGLERYNMIEAYNLGSQVTNEEFVQKAIELNADVLLVSQTVTQKDVHLANLTELVELFEGMNIRHKFVIIAGGPRISHELAKEIGYDAGFGSGKYADDVATFFVNELLRRIQTDKNSD